MATSQPTLTELAATVSQAVKTLTSHLDANGLPAPSFAEDGPVSYPGAPEVQGTRFQLIQALSDMLHLVIGPAEMAFVQPCFLNHDAMTLDVLNQFDFFGAIPLGGSASYSEIARATTLPESIVRRILRHAVSARLFAESPPGSDKVVHTATTAHIAKTPLLRSWLSHNLEEIRPGMVHVPEALRKFSAGRDKPSEEILESGFSLADLDKVGHPTDYWEFLRHEAEGKPKGYRAKRFNEAMQAASMTSAISRDEVVKSGFDWDSLGSATVVDVGGSGGHDAVLLAKSFPSLNVIVQDLPEVEASFESYVPQEFRSRVTFQARDFFTPQTVTADVYFLKMILHDWPDRYASKILKNLLPSLKPGGRIVLCEGVSPPTHDASGTALMPLYLQRIMSVSDLQMLVGFNSLERKLEDWKALLKQTDERLEVVNVSSQPGAIWSVVEIKLRG